ncbi:MAG: tetratricopeptide repeat protein [Actinomycetota bacterium]|nr:tetratricopeptide repeat protein [Actinomycetota bacterium]
MDAAAIEREVHDAVRRGDDEAAIGLIEEAVARPGAAEGLWLPSLYEDLANCYARLGRYDDAIAAIDKCIESGYKGEPDARAFKAEFFLQDGRLDEASALFDEVMAEAPDDVWLYNQAALAYQGVGNYERALVWVTHGFELALATGDPEVVAQLSDIRRVSLKHLGRKLDELENRADVFLEERLAELRSQRLGRDVERAPGVEVGLAWFPKGEYERAIELWPSIREDWTSISHPEYCRSIERELQRFREAGTGIRWVAPINIDEYVQWCEQKERDPEESSSRANYAAEVVRTGTARVWPPGRNDPCWCGSMAKYKRCCAALRPVS